jgi:hypothetical protein
MFFRVYYRRFVFSRVGESRVVFRFPPGTCRWPHWSRFGCVSAVFIGIYFIYFLRFRLNRSTFVRFFPHFLTPFCACYLLKKNIWVEGIV